MTGISPNTLNRLRAVLLSCSQFTSNGSLPAIFTDARISLWRGELLQMPSQDGRIDSLIHVLHDKCNRNGDNALVLLLNVLRDRIDSEDSRHSQLAEISDVLRAEVGPLHQTDSAISEKGVSKKAETARGLEPHERAWLRQFMAKNFDLTALKELSFDLSIDYKIFPHNSSGELCIELISYSERKNSLSCLVMELLKRTEHPKLAELISKLPSCSPRKKVQIILSTDVLLDEDQLISDLATRLKVKPEEIMIISTLPGSIRLLVSMPVDAAEALIDAKISRLANREYKIISIDAYDDLSYMDKTEWKETIIGKLGVKHKAPRNSLSIVIIDDEPVIVDMLVALLSDEGYDVFGTSGSSEGLALILQNPPDLLILDLMMPDLSGLQVLDTLRDNYDTLNLPVILLGAASPQDLIAYEHTMLMPKPFTLDALLEAIHFLIQHHSTFSTEPPL